MTSPRDHRPLAVLLDLDGTLVDSVEFILACARHAFTGYPGRVPTDAEWSALIGMPLRQCVASFAEPGDVDRLVARYREHQLAHHDDLTRAFEGVPDVLRRLHARGHPLALVTGKSTSLAQRSLAVVGLDRMIPVVVGADSCPGHKPDPEPVLLALSLLDYPAERAIFVGDSVHDMAAGRAAGVTTVAALWGASTREMLEPGAPDFWMESMAELPGLVERLEAPVRQ